MYVNIINQTLYKQIKIVYYDREYILKKDESVSVFVTGNNYNFEVFVLEKNRVILNLLFAFVNGFVDEESVINSLVCDVSFKIKETESEQAIMIKDLEYRDDNHGYIYESVYIENDDIENISYTLTNTNKEQKRSLFYYICVVSWLPIIIVLLGYYFLFKGNILAVVVSLLILFVFTVPSWKKASNVKKYYSNEFSNEVLTKEAIKQREQNGKVSTEYPKDIIGKATYKALDFIFKRKK